MLKTLGIIDGLLTTDRQRRNASRTLGGKTVLEWVARQMTDSAQLDGVVMMTDESEENGFIRMMTPLDVPVFMTNAKDTLAAMSAVLENFSAKNCVYIGLDWPLIDSYLVDRLIIAGEANPNGQYAAFQFKNSHCSVSGKPTGMFAEWYRSSAIAQASRNAVDPMHREYPGMYFLEQAPKESLTLIQAPPQLDRDDIRLTIENEDDWENMVMIFESIDADNIQWNCIADAILHQPHLRKAMSHHNMKVKIH